MERVLRDGSGHAARDEEPPTWLLLFLVAVCYPHASIRSDVSPAEWPLDAERNLDRILDDFPGTHHPTTSLDVFSPWLRIGNLGCSLMFVHLVESYTWWHNCVGQLRESRIARSRRVGKDHPITDDMPFSMQRYTQDAHFISPPFHMTNRSAIGCTLLIRTYGYSGTRSSLGGGGRIN